MCGNEVYCNVVFHRSQTELYVVHVRCTKCEIYFYGHVIKEVYDKPERIVRYSAFKVKPNATSAFEDIFYKRFVKEIIHQSIKKYTSDKDIYNKFFEVVKKYCTEQNWKIYPLDIV